MQSTLPTQADQRIKLMDALRGFAIFGIFGINMVATSGHWLGDAADKLIWFGKMEEIFNWLLEAFIEGKFYSIFSLLFGIGFGMQLYRENGIDVDRLPLFKKRLWGLLLIGIAHSLLLWVGDILFLYAWLGFLLVVFRNKSDQWLLRAALICLAIPVVLFPLRFLHPFATLATPIYGLVLEVAPLLGYDNIMQESWEQLQSKPGWGNFFKMNAMSFIFRQADLFDQVRPFKVFAMFLLGYWVSKQQWQLHPEAFTAKFKKWILPALIISVIINLIMAKISWGTYYSGELQGWLKTFLYFAGVVPLALCYVYYFVYAYTSARFPILETFTHVGRMALSNYLFQSVLYVLLFRAPFLHLFGKLSPIACIALVLVIFPLQILFSKWWLSKFYYGPIEWLWRSLTYGKYQKWRKVPQLIT
jgi:uncharacterized protein